MKRSEAARVLREHRRASRRNPHAVEAEGRRRAARLGLATALGELEGCFELPARSFAPPTKDGAWRGPQVDERAYMAAKAAGEGGKSRMQDVMRCGTAHVAWDTSIRAWVEGDHGLLVCQVDECGHRLCPNCAPRAGRRNRKRLGERVALLDTAAASAAGGTLAAAHHGGVDEADNAVVVLRAAFRGVVGGFDAAVEANVARLAAVELNRRRVDDACELFAFGIALAPRPAIDVDAMPGGEAFLAAACYQVHAQKGQRSALRALARAIAREEAAAALQEVESAARRNKLRGVERAAVNAVSFFNAPGEVHGPACWRPRERARWEGQSAALSPRSMRSIARQDAEAWGRLRHEHERFAGDHARTLVDVALRAGKEFRADRTAARRLASRSTLWRSQDVRFATFTQQALPAETCNDALARLNDALKVMMRSTRWQSHVAGAIVRIEVERSTKQSRTRKAQSVLVDAGVLRAAGLVEAADERERSGLALLARGQTAAQWHVHAHMAVASGFWDRADMLALWRKSAGTMAVNVDVRTFEHGGGVNLKELCKYVTKPLGIGDMSTAETQDLITAIHGRRLLRCTGAMRGLVVEDGKKASVEKEGWMGDGESKPLGFVKECDDSYPLPVYVSTPSLVWREDEAAQEARRARLELQWDLHRSGKVRGSVDDLPAT